jgi:hypothetical protein
MPENLTLAVMLDREAIRDCIYRAALANDRRDATTWKDVYWPDAHEDHSTLFNGNAHDFVDAIIPMLNETMDTTWHQISGTVIQLDGHAARAISYCNAHVRMKPLDGAPSFNLRSGLRYLDCLEKRDGEWRIVSRATHSDWSMQTPILKNIKEFGDTPPEGMHVARDPAHSFFLGGMPDSLRIKKEAP